MSRPEQIESVRHCSDTPDILALAHGDLRHALEQVNDDEPGRQGFERRSQKKRITEPKIFKRRSAYCAKTQPARNVNDSGMLKWPGRRSQPGVQHSGWRTLARMNTRHLQFLILIIAGWVNRSRHKVG